MPEIKIGYKLCGEEQSPQELIDCARRAEEVGFDFAMIRTTTTPSPNKELKREFEKTGGKWIPCYAEVAVCWAKEESEARRFERSLTGTRP